MVVRAWPWSFRHLPQAQGRQKVTDGAATGFPFAAVFWERSHERNIYLVVVDRAGAFCIRSLPQAQGRQKITSVSATEFLFAVAFWERSHERNAYSFMGVWTGVGSFRHLPQAQGRQKIIHAARASAVALDTVEAKRRRIDSKRMFFLVITRSFLLHDTLRCIFSLPSYSAGDTMKATGMRPAHHALLALALSASPSSTRKKQEITTECPAMEFGDIIVWLIGLGSFFVSLYLNNKNNKEDKK
jgi:hypothetical protein